MSYTNIIEKLTGIQEILKINVNENKNGLEVFIVLKRKMHKCPVCGNETNRIHDYRKQRIKDLSSFGKPVELLLRKRRYVCEKCNKKFPEQISFVSKYQRMTQRMIMKILESLESTTCFSNIAKEYGVSINTVIRIFDNISYPRAHKLPLALSIDEFKGNTGGEKYNCIIADPLNHVVIDILPKRYESYVLDYFLKTNESERGKVSIFVSDMWKPYQDIAKSIFKNSLIVVDKYHWSRQIIWSFERVRKRVQKQLSDEKRRYFKHSRNLLLQQFEYLSTEDKQAVNVMLYVSADLSTAHFYKEEFQKILRSNNILEAKQRMNEWIDSALVCGVKEIEDCAKTMNFWKPEILDSFKTSCTNGFIEGCNNKIKVLKRNAFGYKNFNRFRNRILYMFSAQKQA